MHPLEIQASIAVPIVLGLALYTATMRGRSRLHLLMSAALGLITLWMISLVMSDSNPNGPIGGLGMVILMPVGFALAPLYFLATTRFARIQSFEDNPAADAAVMAPFALYYLAYLTNDWHGLFFLEPTARLRGAPLAQWAGPVWWGSQLSATAVAAAGLVICARIALFGTVPDERRRAWLLMLAAFAPVAAHHAHVFRLLPLDFSLMPSALALSAVLVTTAVRRYNLLEVRPVARRDVIEALPDGVILANVDGVVVDANPAIARLLDTSPAAMHGASLPQLLEHWLNSDRTGSNLRRLLEHPEAFGIGHSITLETSDRRSLEVSAGITGERGSPASGHFIVFRDRTRERGTERQLHQAQKLESVGVLAAGVAHEVNNPLAYVRANLDYLSGMADEVKRNAGPMSKEVLAGIEEAREILAESSAGIDRIASIVESLLRFSRTPSEDRQLIDLNKVIVESLRLASFQGGRNVVVNQQLAEDLPRVQGSSGQLVQVLLNLLLNAKQALRGRADAAIEIRTSCDGEGVTVSVRDNGPGISRSEQSRIFDPFYTTRNPGEGTGLGLAIAHEIVREHGGNITVESLEEQGAAFVVRFPPIPSEGG